MAANSNHFVDVTTWIERVIDSCTSPSQEKAARNLIKLYTEKLRFEGRSSQFVWVIEKYLSQRISNITYTKRNEDGNTN